MKKFLHDESPDTFGIYTLRSSLLSLMNHQNAGVLPGICIHPFLFLKLNAFLEKERDWWR